MLLDSLGSSRAIDADKQNVNDNVNDDDDDDDDKDVDAKNKDDDSSTDAVWMLTVADKFHAPKLRAACFEVNEFFVFCFET